MQEFVGKEVTFEAQPYHRGTAIVTHIDECEPNGWKDCAIVTIRTIDATERSRLFGAVSHRPHNGREIQCYPIDRRALERGHIVHIYPV